MPRVYIVDDPSPNAFATGRDPQHAAIAVTTGLLAKLDKPELEGVLSHELSHIGNYDILLSSVVVVLVGFVVLLSDFFLRYTFWFGGGGAGASGGGDAGEVGVILLLVGIVLALLSPLFAMLIQLAISRRRELLADASGALLTRNPNELADALEKITADPVSMRHVEQGHGAPVDREPAARHRGQDARLARGAVRHAPGPGRPHRAAARDGDAARRWRALALPAEHLAETRHDNRPPRQPRVACAGRSGAGRP